jgi:DNA-binding LytR/AlgR family response regulator
MYTCIAVDDQQESIDLITDHVTKIPQLSLEFSTCSPHEALAYLDDNKPDIIFLDIQMPNLNGIELIETLKEKWGNNIPDIILITGYNNHSLKGFELGVTDYILKPVTFKRFKNAVDRIINKLNKQVTENNKSANFFFVEADSKKVKINYEEIVYIEGARNYIIIVLQNKKLIVYKTMSFMVETLPPDKFIRIHKSYIVSVEKITAIQGNKVIVDYRNEELRLPVGLTYKSNVIKKLNVM